MVRKLEVVEVKFESIEVDIVGCMVIVLKINFVEVLSIDSVNGNYKLRLEN